MTKSNKIRMYGAVLLFLPLTSSSDQSFCKIAEKDTLCETMGEDGNVVTKLIPKQESPYATELDRLPTVIISSKTLGDLEKALLSDKGAPLYNKYLPLPHSDAIESVSHLSSYGVDKLKFQNWKVSNIKSITYHGSGGNEGFGLVCLTLENMATDKFIAILQCNDFYPADIQNLKSLASSIIHQ